jgi:para-nitrobenzyl esterase
MAPQPPQPWTGVRAADRFANQACQIPFAFLNPALADDPAQAANRDFHRGVEDHPIPYGEDCLALNVWTPSTHGKRPVMVWLHGGGFASGSGSWGWWTGDDMAARQDVVVVTINHRLNIFGFLSLQDHGGEAQGLVTNAGMRDILMALAWVRDMIAGFGGDPDNVTIFGQSGGGMKVATLMAMPSASSCKAACTTSDTLRLWPR